MYQSDCRFSVLCVNRTLIAMSLCLRCTSMCVSMSCPSWRSVSWSGILLCVLWTPRVGVLADKSKCSRSGEAAKQDIPSLSYRLPLLLWQTHRDPSSPVLFLLFSLSSLTCFLGYNLTVFFTFPPLISSARLLWCSRVSPCFDLLRFSASSILNHTSSFSSHVLTPLLHASSS